MLRERQGEKRGGKVWNEGGVGGKEEEDEKAGEAMCCNGRSSCQLVMAQHRVSNLNQGSF